MNPWGVLADDLTGATDTAAAFANAGFSAAVVLQAPKLNELNAAVLILSSNSRLDRPASARRKVVLACSQLQRYGARLIYKKMDSTLQGNIVEEVEAIRDAAGFDAALVCPANPKQGRLIRHGRLTVRGDPHSSLLERFQAQGLRDLATAFLPLSQRKVLRALGRARFVIADAVTERDLKLLASSALPQNVLLAGSAGMAAALAKILATNQAKITSRGIAQRCPGFGSRPMLIFCGSNNPVTHRQVGALVAKTGARVLDLADVPPMMVRHSLARGTSVVVQVPVHSRPDGELLRRMRRLGPLLPERGSGGLVLTGGDTARLVCRWLKPRALLVRGELAPGLAWGHFVGGLADGVPVCTKPGGFGTRDCLVKLSSKPS